jgi:hypothetical protein
MTTKWEPGRFDKDPTVNALLNIAASLKRLAEATGRLLYGFKYGQRDGMSIAEAIEVASNNIAGSIQDAGNRIG